MGLGLMSRAHSLPSSGWTSGKFSRLADQRGTIRKIGIAGWACACEDSQDFATTMVHLSMGALGHLPRREMRLSPIVWEMELLSNHCASKQPLDSSLGEFVSPPPKAIWQSRPAGPTQLDSSRARYPARWFLWIDGDPCLPSPRSEFGPACLRKTGSGHSSGDLRRRGDCRRRGFVLPLLTPLSRSLHGGSPSGAERLFEDLPFLTPLPPTPSLLALFALPT